MPKYNDLPIAFYRTSPGVQPGEGRTNNDGSEQYGFVITDFDISTAANANVYILGDEYRIASYGERYNVKKIQGVIPNPLVNFMDAIQFYYAVGIMHNYGHNINISYKNYHGYGHIVGMDIAISGDEVGTISLTFVELGVDRSISLPPSTEDEPEATPVEEYNNALKNKHNFYDTISNDRIKSPASIAFYPFTVEEGTPERGIGTYHHLQKLVFGFNTRYSIIDTKQNIIYFGESPIQFSASTIVVDQDHNFRNMVNTINNSFALRNSNMGDAILSIAAIYVPMHILMISTTESAQQQNYLQVTLQGIISPRDVY